MTYDELYLMLTDMPYLNPRLEKRNTVCGIKHILTINEEHDDFKTIILDERFADVNTKEGMLFVIKEQLEYDIAVLKEILEYVNDMQNS